MIFPAVVIEDKHTIYIAPEPLKELPEDELRTGKYRKNYFIYEKTGKLYRISEAIPDTPLPKRSCLKRILYFLKKNFSPSGYCLNFIPSKIKYEEIKKYELSELKEKINNFCFINKYTSIIDIDADDDIIFEQLKEISSFSEFIVLIALSGYLLDYEKGYKKAGIPRGKPQYFTDKVDKEFVQKRIRELASEINYIDCEV